MVLYSTVVWVLEVGIEDPQRIVIKLFLRRAQPLFYFEVDEKHRRHVQKNFTLLTIRNYDVTSVQILIVF